MKNYPSHYAANWLTQDRAIIPEEKRNFVKPSIDSDKVRQTLFAAELGTENIVIKTGDRISKLTDITLQLDSKNQNYIYITSIN